MDANPYLPPRSILIDESTALDAGLADKMQRFLAALLDGLVGLAVGIPLMFMLGTFDYVRRGQRLPLSLTAATIALGFLGFVLLHGYFLKKDGQTIGKRVVGIRIAAMDNSVPNLAKVLLLRYLPIQCANLIPLVGAFYPLIDVLFIFRQDRRCLHDMLAGTKVVKAK